MIRSSNGLCVALKLAGTYKANFNAAIFEELHCAGLGVVY